MAKTVNVVTIDDLDGSSGADAVSFSLNGQRYEIDLAPANLNRMRATLQPFIDAGRQTGQRNPARTAARRADSAAIRAWAAGQGLQVAERGRLSADVLSRYNLAHHASRTAAPASS